MLPLRGRAQFIQRSARVSGAGEVAVVAQDLWPHGWDACAAWAGVSVAADRGAGDVPDIAWVVLLVWGDVRIDAGVLHRSAADGRPGALPSEHHDRAAGHQGPRDRVVCAGAAGGAAVYGVSAGAAAGADLDRGQDIRTELGREPDPRGGRGVARPALAHEGAGLLDADHAVGAEPVPVQ